MSTFFVCLVCFLLDHIIYLSCHKVLLHQGPMGHVTFHFHSFGVKKKSILVYYSMNERCCMYFVLTVLRNNNNNTMFVDI